MARLPVPGGDNGNWGDLLNEYLRISHNESGTIKAGAVTTNSIVDNSVTAAKLSADVRNQLAATAPVTSVNGESGDVELTPALIGAATAAQGAKADTALQPGDVAPLPVLGGRGYGDAIQSVAVPSYFYPTWYNASDGNKAWERMQAAAPYCSIAIINPSSGAGAAINSDYAEQTLRARAAGLHIYGYISTNYAAISTAIIQEQIDNYFTWYHVDGIFFDEASSNTEDVAYYKSLYQYVKAKQSNAIVVLNHGQPSFDESYMQACDITLNFENTTSTYMSATFPNWTIHYPSHRFWHVCYGLTSPSEIPDLISKTKENRAGNIYFTNDTMADSNPYDALPDDTYWQPLITAVK